MSAKAIALVKKCLKTKDPYLELGSRVNVETQAQS